MSANSRPAVVDGRERQPVGHNPDRCVQAWCAWADCGDGGQVNLIIDSPARQIWLWPADEHNNIPRSVQ
jgi:hypothetical protein